MNEIETNLHRLPPNFELGFPMEPTMRLPAVNVSENKPRWENLKLELVCTQESIVPKQLQGLFSWSETNDNGARQNWKKSEVEICQAGGIDPNLKNVYLNL